jgi:hypothetical protein
MQKPKKSRSLRSMQEPGALARHVRADRGADLGALLENASMVSTQRSRDGCAAPARACAHEDA